MRIGRTLPPAAAPVSFTDLVRGFLGIVRGQRELDRFQSELKAHFGVKHCFLVSSGKAALTLILHALRELAPDRDEVVIPAFTCFSVPSSIVRAELRVRLCDLDTDCLDFDFEQLSTVLSGGQYGRTLADAAGRSYQRSRNTTDRFADPRKILAVVPTHLFGIPADVSTLRQLINDPRVTLVEDAAQAMGEIRDGRKVGTFGDVSFFSLGRGKALSVVEGGIILTNRDDLAEKLNSHMQRIPRYGPLSLLNLIVKAAALMVLIHPWMFWLPRGIPLLKLGETLFEPNFPIRRMSSFQAGLAGNWRRKLDRMRDVRQKNVTRWVAFLDASRIGASHFLDSQALALPRFPLRIGDSARRTFLLDEFTGRRLGIMPVYPTSIDAIPELKGNVAGSFPVAERCARELVTLPTHAYLTEHDIARLRRLLTSISGEKKRL